MLEQFVYVNHRNETLEFGKGKIFANSNELHDYTWAVTKKNNRISELNKGVVNKKIPLVIKCDTEEEGTEIRNKLMEVFEKDVLAMQYGKIIIGDYYLKCFVVESKKKDYLKNKSYMQVTLKISTDEATWIKETIRTFGYSTGTSGGKNLDYNNDFPYDYTSNLLNKSLNNPGFMESHFRLTIYGACKNPTVTIAGHDHTVNVSMEANEYLTIDSMAKTIILTHTDGRKENCFNMRSRDSYVFQKIPSGVSTVLYNGEFKFDITLFEERSEPKWT